MRTIIIKSYPSLAELQDNVDVAIVLKKSMEPNDMLVVETFVDVYFLNHLFPRVVLQQKFFRDNFSRKNETGLDVCYLVAFRKSTLTEKWEEKRLARTSVKIRCMIMLGGLWAQILKYLALRLYLAKETASLVGDVRRCTRVDDDFWDITNFRLLRSHFRWSFLLKKFQNL